MKKILFFIFLIFLMGCEKDPVINPKPVDPPKNPPTITFENLWSENPEVEYGQGLEFKAKSTVGSKLSVNGTDIGTNVIEIKLKELVKDTTFMFSSIKDNLTSTKTLTIKVLPADPFFLKLIGVWRQTGKRELFDFPKGDRSKPMEWEVYTADTTICNGSRRKAFTLDRRYVEISASNCFLFSPIAFSPWTKITKEEKLGVEMYYIHHEAAKGNEAGGAYEYYYFKGDTLIMYQEIRLDPLVTAFRSFKRYFVIETKDYKAYIKNAEDTYTPAPLPSSVINPNFSIRMTTGGNMVMLK